MLFFISLYPLWSWLLLARLSPSNPTYWLCNHCRMFRWISMGILLQILWAPYLIKFTFLFSRLDCCYLIFLHSLESLQIILINTHGRYLYGFLKKPQCLQFSNQQESFPLFLNTLTVLWTFDRMIRGIEFPLKPTNSSGSKLLFPKTVLRSLFSLVFYFLPLPIMLYWLSI